jgi:hypothetical protein
MRRFSLLLFSFCVSLLSCESDKDPTLFELLPASQTGVDFENTLESTSKVNILEYLYFYNGSGVTAGDINNDGLVDLYFGGNQVSNKLYLNRGDFKFEDITEKAGVSGDKGWTTGVIMVDVNGDGLLDIYVNQVGGYKGIQGKNKLYINQGDEKFVEESEKYGVAFEGLSTQAVFFDMDRDGDLDMYLLTHSVKSPEVFAPAKARNTSDPKGDKLFLNLSSQGQNRFEDVTEKAGIYSSQLGFGLGVGVSDIDGDGWPDIYASNDFTENDYVYLNQQDGTFKESLETILSSSSRFSMGNDLADINGDGLPEIFTTDMLPEDPAIWMKSVGEDKPEVFQIKKQFGYGDQYVRNHLHLNQGNGNFSEIALFSEVYATDWSWSPLIFDMDNDGLPDIHITNGIVKRPNDLDFVQYFQEGARLLSSTELQAKQIELLPSVKLSNFTYKNIGNLKFVNQGEDWGLDQPSYSNGSTYADLDNDGDLDLVINNINQPAFIYRNHAEKSKNHFLRIKLKEEGRNPFAIGAKVSLFAAQKSWSQTVSTTRGFLSGPSSTLVFGLGKVSHLDSIQVDWPDGTSESFLNITSDRSLTLQKGSGEVVTVELQKTSNSSPEVPLISWRHEENAVPEHTKREYLIPRSYSEMGPALAVGDVNQDDLEDIYLGGAIGQPGVLLVQKKDGSFKEYSNPIFLQFAKAEDTAAAFADFNGDGFLDLYVGSGGHEFKSGSLFLNDRVFFGNGKGDFKFNPMSLPLIGENTADLAIYDINGDGFLDVFVGTSVIFGDYGASPKSTLLLNQGNGNFKDVTKKWFDSKIDLGMINSANWVDMDGDGIAELIIGGDWQPVRIFRIIDSKKIVELQLSGLERSAGMVQTIAAGDFNSDGRVDLAVGNLGLNSKLKASIDAPIWMYHSDFDHNSQSEAIIFHYMGNKLVPLASRDDLIKQIPGLKKKHSSYLEYSQISRPEDLFSKEQLSTADNYPIYELRSGVYFQDVSGGFSFEPFPLEAQFSPITALAWDAQSKTLFTGGNLSGFRVDLGKTKARSVSRLIRKDNSWTVSNSQISIPISAEIRKMKFITVDSTKLLLAPVNNGGVYTIQIQ